MPGSSSNNIYMQEFTKFWCYVKTKPQEISGVWNFTGGLQVDGCDVATTCDLPNYDDVVYTTDIDQVINGNKSFVNPLVVPDAVANNQAVNLGQLNAAIPPSGNYIDNQNSIAQVANFWITGNGQLNKLTVGNVPANVSDYGLGMQYLTSGGSGIYAASDAQLIANVSSDTTGNYYGSVGVASTGSGSHTYGLVGGLYGSSSVRGNSTATLAPAIIAGTPFFSNTGSIPTAIGLQINNQSITGVTSGIGIAQVGLLDINYFNGNTGFQTLTPTSNVHISQGTTGIGAVTVTNGSPTVTGFKTQFLNTFRINDTIVTSGQTKIIQSISSNTILTTTTNFTVNSVLPTPVLLSASIINTTGSFPTGNRFYVITWVNGSGETIKSNEISVNITSPNSLVQLNWTAPIGVTSINIYIGTTTGVYTSVINTTNYQQYNDTTGVGTTSSGPPISNTALGPAPYTLSGGTIAQFFGNGNVNFPRLQSGTPLYNVLIDSSGNLITGAVPVGGGTSTLTYSVSTGTGLTGGSFNNTANRTFALDTTYTDGRYLTLSTPNQTVNQIPTFTGTGATGGIIIVPSNATTDGLHVNDTVGAGFSGFYGSENYQLSYGGDSRKITTSIGGSSVYDATNTIIYSQNWSTDPTKILITGLPVQYGNGLRSLVTPSVAADVVPLNYLQANYTSNQVDVFTIAGQSNAVGSYADISLQPTIPSGWAYMWNGTTVVTVTSGSIGGLAGGGTAWSAFAISYYNRTGRPVLFVPTAKGGTSQAAAGDTGFGNWDTSGTLVTASITATDAALAATLAATGLTPVFKGILWDQGENDANAIGASTYPVSTYTTAFNTMRATFRTHYGPQMPFYIFRTGGTLSGNLQVQTAQEAIALTEQNTSIVFREARDYTVANGYLNSSSPAHYTQLGYNRMGQIGAETILSIRHLDFWQGEFGNFGTTTSSNITTLSVNTPITSQAGGTAYGILVNGVIQSDVTTKTAYISIQPQTLAASFTLPTLNAIEVGAVTFGAGSSVTSLAGINILSTFTGGTTNTYGVRSQLASGTGVYNIYANGTAPNIFTGLVGLGTVTSPVASLHIGGTRTLAAWGNIPPLFYVASCTVTDSSTADNTTVTNAFMNYFASPIIQATNAATSIIYTNTATLTIGGEPTAGTNVSFTNSAALDIVTGKVRIRNLTASRAVQTDANSNLTTVAVTGSGSAVLQTSPSLITPTLGVATATSINKVAFTTPASLATLTLASGSTLATGAGMTLTTVGAVSGQTFTFPTTSATLARTDAAQTFTGIQSFTSNPIFNTTSIVGQYWVATNTTGSGNWTTPTAVNRSHTIFTPSTGGTVILVNNQINIVNPSGTLATLTLTLPSSPANNDIVNISFTQAVTTITYSGGTVVGGPTTASLGGQWYLTYDSGTTTWY